MQRGFQRRLRALFQSCSQTLEPLSELLDSFPCVIFLLCLPLRHLHNNHDRVRTDVTLPDSHTHAHAEGEGRAHSVLHIHIALMSTKHPWPYSDHTLHTDYTWNVYSTARLRMIGVLDSPDAMLLRSMQRHCRSAMTSKHSILWQTTSNMKQHLLYFHKRFNQPSISPRHDSLCLRGHTQGLAFTTSPMWC